MKKIFVLLIAVFALSSTLWAEEVQLQYRFEERKTDIWSTSEIRDKEKLLAKYEKALPKYEAAAQKKPGDYFAEKLVRKTKMQILFLRDDLARAKAGQPVKGGVEVNLPKMNNFGWTELNILVKDQPIVEKVPHATFTVYLRYIAPEGGNDQLSTPNLEQLGDRKTRVSNLRFDDAAKFEVVSVGNQPEWILIEDSKGGLWSVFISYASRESSNDVGSGGGGGGSGGSGGGGSGGGGGGTGGGGGGGGSGL